MLPAAVVVDDPFHRRLDVLGERRVSVLVDRHPGSRVRHVDQCRRGTVRGAERRLHLFRDVEQLCLSLGLQADLAHAVILRPVPSTSPTPADLEGYREGADRFIAELDEEYYLHFAGLKDKLELEPIYERHQDLTTLEWTQALGQAVNGDRKIRELWRFACEGHLGNLTKEHSEKAAALETELEAEVDGEKVGFRMLRPTIANTDDRGKRERLDEARKELTEEHLNPIYLDAVSIAQQAVPKLGSPNYVELYRRFGYRLDDLAAQCRAVLDSTEQMYEDATDKLFRDRI